MDQLTTGQTAPDFRLLNPDGQWVSMKDYSGSKLILFFYPAAMTPGCTIEVTDFTAARTTINNAGYEIVGISPDPPDILSEFINRHSLNVTLLSDPSTGTIKAYGAWGDRMIWGKTITGVIRSTFLIDVDQDGIGTITEAQYGVRATGHVDRLLTALGLVS